MLCLSGFKLYSRWVPLINISCFLRQKSIVKRMFDQESCLFKLLGALFWQIQNLVCDLLCQLKSERSTCKYTKYTLLLRPISQVESVYTAISRKVVGKNVHATIPKGNMGYGQYTVPDLLSCQTYFCCFPLALTNIRPWPLMPFFETSLKSSELKTTHNPFRDCRVHFFRQPFSK